jgi:hypothetical protein
MSTSQDVPGKTLGLDGSGNSQFASFLEDVAWYLTIRC